MNKHKWFLAGDRGLVGTNFKQLYNNVTGVNTSNCNLELYEDTISNIANKQPSHVMINAATVGGLMDDIKNSFELYI